jgi:predicted ATPase
MIKTFRVQNYKALRDVTLELTPLHVLIGPNDSGKTSVLEALGAHCRATRLVLNEAFEGRWQGRALVWRQQANATVRLETTVEENGARFSHVLSCQFAGEGRDARTVEDVVLDGAGRSIFDFGRGAPYSGLMNNPSEPRVVAFRDAIAGLQSYRWIPSRLALPVAFDFSTRFGMEASGFGLAMNLNDILAHDHERFGQLERRFRSIFPSVKRIRLQREPGFVNGGLSGMASGLGIYFEQSEGEILLSAAQASDGLLLVLAYLAILYSPEPPRLLLIEEPENGVHPQRLREVLQILTELVSEHDRTQVLMTTHSPYVVDQFKPKEVTLCLKGTDGAVTTHRLSNSKSVREQMDIFQLGEIWTAEGDEALAAPADAQEIPTP